MPNNFVVPRYLLPIEKHAITSAVFDDDAAEGMTGKQRATHKDSCDGDVQQVDEEGNAGSVGPVRTKRSQAEKKAKRGANTGRRWTKMRDEIELCWKIENGEICEFGDKYVILLFSTDMAS
jgi:tRNA-dihydrouridine synthase 3